VESRSVIGKVLSGRYRLDSKLGSGGMSTVYLAQDETLERWVAVKVLHREISDQPGHLERFRREARAVAQVSHPNVVAVIDAGEDGGYPYIVFEYVEGETLKQRIERLERLSLDESTAYAIEVGRGLAAAHARRMIHRDVKPQNVLIDAEGRAKVTDFGIARGLDTKGLTATGRVLGTTDYVSPEQAMGQGTDARSDIYSLGVVLYETLTGDVPFQAETQVGVAMKHVNEPMPDVQRQRPDVSAALSAVVEKSTAKDPDQRYPNMAGMLRDLEGALEVEVARAGGSTGEVTSVLDSVPPPRRKIFTRRRLSWAGILLVLAAGAAALAIAVLTGGDDSQQAAGGGTAQRAVSAGDFDPSSTGGDDDEHSEDVRLAVDGSPTTSWPTESYNTGPTLDAAAGKPGVGLYVDAGKAERATGIQIRTPETGWKAEIYAAPGGPPETISGWGAPVGEATISSDQQTIPIDTRLPSRYYLVWITSLAGSGPYSAEISDVRLIA
jgi:tRNA A-37 threonylcarbamoyl transferase component Bud32